VIVGHDYLEGEIQSFARRLGVGERALFLGKREDVPGLLSIFDVFCLPSIYEGLPLTVLEAMAAGIPVVGADVLGINEVVRHNENGLLFPSNEQEKLEECLHLLLEDDALRRRLSLAGRDSVKERYSIEKMIENYEHLFRSV
jgi:glycosyltransferase involved in cell wall biosynthesis